MDSKSQNPNSSTEDSSQAQSSQATGTAGKATTKGTSRAENVGTDMISGLNGLDSPEQARGKVEQLGQLNSQTGAAGKAKAALSSQNTPVQKGEETEDAEGANGGANWQSALQSTVQSALQQGWTSFSARVKAASPTQLALGAAALGAAVWITTRKRSNSKSSAGQQTAADRWGGYPSGSDGSRSDGHYGQYNSPRGSQPTGQYGSQATSQSQSSQSSESSQSGSQPTNGPASGPYGHSGETWQRPTDERWDD